MKQVHLVHCVDTEGPLHESIDATFERLSAITGSTWDSSPENYDSLLNGTLTTNDPDVDSQILRTFNKETLNYCSDWRKIEESVEKVLRAQAVGHWIDDRGDTLPTTWFAMDHFNLGENPRQKEVQLFEITRRYEELIESFSTHDLNPIEFHFHCQSVSENPLAAAHCLSNSLREFHLSLATRILESGKFPTVFRPGFHSERQDLNLLLEQWIPFDFGNQRQLIEDVGANERFGDWRRAPETWSGYHPDHRYVFQQGDCNRKIFRCLNVGTRLRNLSEAEINEAFEQANSGATSVLAFCQHDFRPIYAGIESVVEQVRTVQQGFPGVELVFSTAQEAARSTCDPSPDLRLRCEIVSNRLFVEVKQGRLFGSQPYLAFELRGQGVSHDNFDIVVPEKIFSYTFDAETVCLENVTRIAIGAAGVGGSQVVEHVRF